MAQPTVRRCQLQWHQWCSSERICKWQCGLRLRSRVFHLSSAGYDFEGLRVISEAPNGSFWIGGVTGSEGLPFIGAEGAGTRRSR